MSRHAKASSVGSIDGSGMGRGLFRRAFAIRGASGGSGGSGARSSGRLGSLFAVLALTTCAFALTAAPASAAEPLPPTVTAVSEVSYGSAHVTGTIDNLRSNYWTFEYSSDGGATWVQVSGEFGNFLEGGGGLVPVEADLNLKGGTHYEVRLTARYHGSSDTPPEPELHSAAPNPEFTTLPVDPPAVLKIDDASEVAYTTAHVSGEVERPANPASPPFDPNAAFNANCNFEYVSDQQFSETGFETASPAGCEPENPVTSSDGEAVTKPVTANLGNLAPSTTYHLRLSVSNAGGSDSKVAASTFTTLAVPAPGVSELEVTNVTASSAHFSGAINPLAPGADTAFEVSWHFECNPECPGLEGGTIAPDNSPHPVTGDTTGLQPNTTYEVSLVAANNGGTTTVGPVPFTTEAPAPLAQTLGVGRLAPNSASLAGRVNPQNSPVTYQFEWGLNSAYANKAPATAEPLGVADNTLHLVTTPLAGLSPDTVYHYRIVSTNSQTSEESFGQDRAFTTPPAPQPPAACPNEPSRVGPSAGLPDCRAYELATPDMNGATINREGSGRTLADGSAISFNVYDAPDNAKGSFVFAQVVATRGTNGWATKSFSQPTPQPATEYHPNGMALLSADLSQSVVLSTQPLAGPGSPSGYNYYLQRADGSFVPITTVGCFLGTLCAGSGSVRGGSQDFSHIFFFAVEKQLDSDPLNKSNLYEWSNGNLKLVGILPGPGEVPAPQGAGMEGATPLPWFSDDGDNALFKEGIIDGGASKLFGPLYLREHGDRTVEVSASQRSVDPDLNPPPSPAVAGITGDGSEVLFTSRSELTNDANTGENGGDANDRGSDLYSYDVQSKKLTDLTVDGKPADAATGANVTRVVGSSPDGSYVYFTATGALAGDAISGHENLYVEHDHTITFVASDPDPFIRSVYITPDGTHAAFLSPASLTGYDNTNPNTGKSELEAFKYTFGSGLECASCRPSGQPPTSGAVLLGRVLSNDGSRFFFQSADALAPEVSNGVNRVYEYEKGQVSLLSPSDGGDSRIFDASASGDDVFFFTHDELGPEATGGTSGIYDARVNAEPSKPAQPVCQGESCRGPSTTPPQLSGTGSSSLQVGLRVGVPGSQSVKGSKINLRVVVPAGGEVKVSGTGLMASSKHAAKPGSLTISVSLKSGANRTRLKKGLFKTKAEVVFKSSVGDISSGEASLAFKAQTKKGGK